MNVAPARSWKRKADEGLARDEGIAEKRRRSVIRGWEDRVGLRLRC